MLNQLKSGLLRVARGAYHALPQGLRVSVAGVVLPQSPRPTTVQMGLLSGMRLDVSPRRERSYIFGTHEPGVQEVLPSLVRHGTTVLDIGANIGFFALGLGRLVGSQGKVVAFEPNAPSVARLRRNVELNQATQVVVEECAVSDYDGEAQFSNALSDTQGRFADLPYLPSNARMVTVPCCKVDSYLQRTRLKPAFIMMDVEHAEGRVLKGMQETMSSLRPTLLIEMHGRAAIGEAWEQLRRAGYRVQLLPGMAEVADGLHIPELSHCVCTPIT